MGQGTLGKHLLHDNEGVTRVFSRAMVVLMKAW